MKIFFSEIWNTSLSEKPERPPEPRDYIWASELGGAFIDRYLKLKGVPPTNPPNTRSKRKFEAGNIMEWIVGIVLKRSGLLIDGQRRCEYQYPGLMKVTGKADYIIGGEPDFDKAEEGILKMDFPEMIGRASMGVIKYLRENYTGKRADEIIYEIKSASDIMFNRYDRINHANPNHLMQCFHYRKSTGYPGEVIYINKDNLLLKEFTVTDDVGLMYKADIQQMTDIFNAGVEPPKEPEIIYDPEICRFSKNWKVEYSQYLTMLYGYQQPEDYRIQWDKITSQINRVFKRCVKEENMTKANLEIITDAKKLFPDWDSLVYDAKGKIVDEPEEEI